jgi:hypothetical protein
MPETEVPSALDLIAEQDDDNVGIFDEDEWNSLWNGVEVMAPAPSRESWMDEIGSPEGVEDKLMQILATGRKPNSLQTLDSASILFLSERAQSKGIFNPKYAKAAEGILEAFGEVNGNKRTKVKTGLITFRQTKCLMGYCRPYVNILREHYGYEL